MIEDTIVKTFEKIETEKSLIDMSIAELAGYYLKHFSGDPKRKINDDIKNNVLPFTKGEKLKIFIDGILCTRR